MPVADARVGQYLFFTSRIFGLSHRPQIVDKRCSRRQDRFISFTVLRHERRSRTGLKVLRSTKGEKATRKEDVSTRRLEDRPTKVLGATASEPKHLNAWTSGQSSLKSVNSDRPKKQTYRSTQLLRQSFRLKHIARNQTDKLVSAIFDSLDELTTSETPSNRSASSEELEESLEEKLRTFTDGLKQSLQGWDDQSTEWHPPALLESLRKAHAVNGKAGLKAQLRFAFHGHVANSSFTIKEIKNQSRLVDLRYPTEWFPATRALQRMIHLHVGPTNSGKTYHALKKLESAASGVYAGPLRLLAHEVYSRLNAKGKSCHLLTGDERILQDDKETRMSSCTVEMTPLNADLEVAVIDEIQMIGDEDRGWAWTQALLGVKAKEVHLCGEVRVIPLIRELAAAMGDKLEIHQYERLSPLRTMSTSLCGNLKNLRKGDCVVSFSRLGIHALKAEIERTTGKRVAVVYGSLPPEIRAQQARLFNDPDNDYDILVASDAIGMGLNLSIKRIVFETTHKMHSGGAMPLSISQVKQIAGRAGRFRTAQQDHAEAMAVADGAEWQDKDQDLRSGQLQSPQKTLGLVTTLEKSHLPAITTAMESEAEPIQTAGIFPPVMVLSRFAAYFPRETPFSYILLRIHELARMHPRFHLCRLRNQVGIADVIHPIKNLTIEDRNIFCESPTPLRDEGMDVVVTAFAKCVANQGGGSLLDISAVNLEVLEQEVTANKEYLRALERLHKSVVLYLWLSYMFAGVFTTRKMAFHVKGLTEQRIDRVLTEFSANTKVRRKMQATREESILRQFRTAVGI